MDPATSWAWAAEVCDSLATNTRNVRNAIHANPNDNITDPLWPEPGQVAGGNEAGYKSNILKWLRLSPFGPGVMWSNRVGSS